MENIGNPAQRLYNIIMEANVSLNKMRNSGNSQPSSWQIWADVFEVETKDFLTENQLRVISRVNQSRILVDEVEALLLKNDKINHQKYLKPFPKFKALFPPPLELTQIFTYAGINTTDQAILDFCIDVIEAKNKEKVVEENELKEILSEIANLYEQVIDLEIDKKLKRILLDMLKIMENAIHEYRIRGVERIGEALEKLVGIYIFNKEVIENSSIEEVKKVKKVLNRFGSMYSFAADTIQLLGAGEAIKNTGEFITKLLGSGE